jgi:hypothetical protein
MAICSDDVSQYHALLKAPVKDYLVMLRRFVQVHYIKDGNAQTRNFVAAGRDRRTK